MIRKAAVCLLVAIFLLAVPVHADAEMVEIELHEFGAVERILVAADVDLAWGREQLSLGRELIKTNNRHYVSLAGLEQLGFQVERSADDASRINLTHADARVNARFAPVYYRDRVVVLMYHALADEPWDAGVLSGEDFRRQMVLLKEKQFNVISMQQYIDFILHDQPVPNNAVLITFDDGYENFYTHAFPVLKELSFPATNFVIVKWIDEPYGLPKLTWDQMREMQQYGMSFYNHTYASHEYGPVDEAGRMRPMLTNRLYRAELGRQETDAEYRARVLQDLTMAEQRLKEELGNETGVLSFPYGAYNEEVLALAEQAGIDVTFTIKPGVNGSAIKNGYRVNAGYRGNDGREMVASLQQGLHNGTDAGPVLYFGEEPLPFAGQDQPFELEDEVWVPLKDLLYTFGMHIRLEREEGVIRIF